MELLFELIEVLDEDLLEPGTDYSKASKVLNKVDKELKRAGFKTLNGSVISKFFDMTWKKAEKERDNLL